MGPLANANSKQCPACWSTVDLQDPQCPHCGNDLQQKKWAGTFIAAALGLIAVGGAGWWWWDQGSANDAPGNPKSIDTADRAQDRQPARPPRTDPGAPRLVPDPEQTAATPRIHRVVYAEDPKRRPVLLVPLDHPGPEALCHYAVPAVYLPLENELSEEDGTPIRFTWITWEHQSDMVLLVGPAPTAAHERLTTRDLRAVSPSESLASVAGGSAKRRPTQIAAHGVPLRLEPTPATGSVVLDAKGRGIAYVAPDGGRALHALDSWRDRWDGKPFSRLQQAIQRRNPRWVVDETRKILAGKGRRRLSLNQVAYCFELLEEVQPLVRDQESREAVEITLRYAHLQKVRLLSGASGSKALAQARSSLRVFPNDPHLLMDATELALEHGTPGDAISFFQTLQRVDAEQARGIEDRIANQVRTKARTLLRGQRNQIAANLLSPVVLAMPKHAALRILYAEALRRLGQTHAAWREATEAARLDSTFASAAQEFQIQPAGGGRVRIAMPRDASTVPTSGNASGHQIGFVIDTGASYTTIPSAVARALGLLSPKNRRVRLTTASGVITTEQVVLPSLVVAGRLTVTNVVAVVHDLPGNLTGKGLLGLNVLKQLNMRIDSKNGYLELSQGGR